MTIKKVRDAMNELAAIFGAAGAKSQNKELVALSQVLEGHEDKSVTDFFSELHQRLAEVKVVATSSRKKAATKKRASTSEALIDQARVDQYVRKLDNAGTDSNVFQVVFSEIRVDKSIRKPEADAIASAYTKGRRTWDTKREAFSAIEATFRDRAYQAVKLVQVDKASRF